MHNTWLIAKREYLERITTKAFLISTILIPVLMGGFVFGSSYLDSRGRSATPHIAIVSPDVQLALDLQSELESARDSKLQADVISPPGPDTRKILNDELDDKSLDGYLWITAASAPDARPGFSYTPASSSSRNNIRSTVATAVSVVLLRNQLSHRGMVSGDVASLSQPVPLETGQYVPVKSSTGVAYVLFFLMYMVVMLYGMNVARSIIEEKTSRVFEVLLATIRPEEMMAGKILGVGSVGLTQVAVWMLAAAILSATPIAASLAGGDMAFSITAVQILFFILYFIFGFLLYSSIAAALGSMTNSEQELQQLNMFLVLPLAFCMFMLPVVISNPNSFWSRVVSLIPFCSPLLMNFRISLRMPAPWELALSFLLMSLAIVATIWIASRIYRIGILMYGKKPTLPEILRWLKYS